MTAITPGEINGETNLYGIIGHPVGHSLSPLIHNAAFRSKNINAVYVPLEAPRANAALKKAILAITNLRGVSVTIPHKTWAWRIADHRDGLTECCGAANTLLREPTGEIRACNTDGPGALKALTGHTQIRGRRILLLGYGGSATAIAHALLLNESPAQLLVHGRNKQKRHRFVEQLRDRHARKAALVGEIDFTEIQAEDIDIIIHTTPLGMKGREQELPLPADFIRDYHTVFDIVYNPARTPLLKLAAARKARTVPGYLMLLYQAVLQFELFTGGPAPEHLMERELLKALRTIT